MKETVKLNQLPTLFQVNFEVSLKTFQKYRAHIAQIMTYPAISLFDRLFYFAVMLQASWHTTDIN